MMAKPDPPCRSGRRMPVHRFWAMLMEDCVTAYYSHPWAWDEIGFGGPAYPRGYMRLENGLPEPWEKDEERYEWNAPVDSLSEFEPQGRDAGTWIAARTRGHALMALDLSGQERRSSPRADADASGADADVCRRTETVDYCIVGVGSRGRRASAASGAGRFQRRRPRSRSVLGYGEGLGQRRKGLARALLERSAHHRRDASARARRKQQRQRRGRRLSSLGGVHSALSSFGLSHLHRRRRGRGLAHVVLGSEALLRTAGARDSGRRSGLVSRGAIRTDILMARIRSAGSAMFWCAAARSSASAALPADRSRFFPHRMATVRTASIADFACRAARSAPKPAR